MQAPHRQNNIALLRLAFAAAVVISHAGPMIDGTRAREPLARLTGTLTLGEVAVDGFFLLSGYLVVKSWQQRRSVWHFLARRALRIIPAFVVAFLLSLLVIAPLGGWPLARLAGSEGSAQAVRLLALMQPLPAGVFPGLPYPLVNGPMWTIAYEARCYLLTALLGTLGFFARPWLSLAATLALLAGYPALMTFAPPVPAEGPPFLGDGPLMLRFLGIYGMGAAFHLFAGRLPLTGRGALLAAACLFAALPIRPIAEPALAVFGGYLLFWAAFKLPPVATPRWDISYGLYLSAWPIATLILWAGLTTSPAILALATLPLAAFYGAASWCLVERPALRLLESVRR